MAHVVQRRVEAAYARSDLFERRRVLMEDRARSLARETAAAAPRPGRAAGADFHRTWKSLRLSHSSSGPARNIARTWTGTSDRPVPATLIHTATPEPEPHNDIEGRFTVDPPPDSHRAGREVVETPSYSAPPDSAEAADPARRRWTGATPLILALVRVRGCRLCSQLRPAPEGGRSRPNYPYVKASGGTIRHEMESHFSVCPWPCGLDRAVSTRSEKPSTVAGRRYTEPSGSRRIERTRRFGRLSWSNSELDRLGSVMVGTMTDGVRSDASERVTAAVFLGVAVNPDFFVKKI